MKPISASCSTPALKLLSTLLAVQMAALGCAPAVAAPAPGQLPEPGAGVSSSVDGNTMTVTSVGGTLGWQSFNIGSEAAVVFQDHPGDVTINNIDGGRSEIFGQLDANGVIYLLNKSGVLFGGGSRVNVGGLVAATMDYDPANNRFINPGSGDITVESGAKINAGAFAYLIGQNVNLSGSVNAGDTLFAAYGGSTSNELVLSTSGGGTITLLLGGSAPTNGGNITLTNNFTNGTYSVTNSETLEVTEIGTSNITLYANGDISQTDSDEHAWDAGGAANLKMETGSGGIAVGNKANQLAATVTAKADNGAITLGAANDLTLGTVSAGNTFTLTAGNIAQAENTSVTAAGADLKATAAGGNVTMGFGENFTGAVKADAQDGSVTLTAAKGIQLDNVTAKNALTVTANAGSITQTGDSSVKVTAADAKTTLKSTGGSITLGNDGNDFSGTVDASASGGVTLKDANALKVGNVSATNGPTSLIAATNLTVTGAVWSGSNIVVKAEKGTLTLESGSSLKADGSGIELGSGGGMTLGGTVTAATKVTATAGGDFANTAAVTARAGDLAVTAARDATLDGALEATAGNVTLTANGGTLTGTANGTIRAGGNADLQSTGDMAVGGTVTAATNVTATAGGNFTNTAAVVAMKGGIAFTSGDDISVENTLTATNGGIVLRATNDVAVSGKVTGGSIGVYAGGDYTGDGELESLSDLEIDVGGDMTLTKALLAPGDVRLTAGTNLTVDATATVTAGTNIVLTASAGDLSVNGEISAGNAVTNTAGGNFLNTAAIIATNGGVWISAGTNATVNADVKAGTDVTATAGASFTNTAAVTAQAGKIDITAEQNVSLDGALEATAGNVTLTANGGTLTSTANGTIQAGGNADLQSIGDMTLVGSVGATTNVTATAGGNFTNTAAITATDGDGRISAGTNITVNADVTAGTDVTATAGGSFSNTAAVTAGQNATIEAAEGVTLDKGVTATAGNVKVTANGGTLTSTVDGSIQAGGNADLQSTGDMTLDGTVTAVTNVTATAGGNFTNTTAITAGQNATMTSSGDMTLLGSVNAKQDATLTAGRGMTVNAAVKADSGDARLAANGGKLETTGNGTVSAGRNAKLASSRDTTLYGTVTAGSNATATAGGNFTNTAVVTAGRDATVEAADVTLDNAVTATAGTVSVTATNGDLQVTANGTVSAGRDAKLSSSRDTTLYGTVTAGNSVSANAGGAFLNTAAVTAKTGDATIAAGDAATLEAKLEATKGTVNATATNGTLQVAGTASVAAGNDAVLTAKTGDMTLDGTVTAGSNVTATAGRNMTVNAAVKGASGNASLKATNTLSISSAGSVAAGKNAVLTAEKGNMTLAGTVTAATNVTATAGGSFTNTAAVTAKKGNAMLTADKGMTVKAAVKAPSGNVALKATNTLSVVSGVPVAGGKDVLLSSGKGSVSVASNATVRAGKDLVILADAGKISFGDKAKAAASGNAVLRAKEDIALSTMSLTARSLGIQSAQGAIRDTKTEKFSAKETMLLVAGKDVTIQGKVNASSLGIRSADDIELGNLDAAKFAANSTGGGVKVTAIRDVELANLSGGRATAKVEAERADTGKTEAVQGSLAGGGGLNGIQAKKDVDFTGKNVSGTQIVSGGKTTVRADAVAVDEISAGSDIDLEASSVDSRTIRAGGSVEADVSGNMKAGTLSAGHDIHLAPVGGDLTADTVAAGGTIDAAIGRSATVAEMGAGDDLHLVTGGDATFATVDAGGVVNADIGGAFAVEEKLTASSVEQLKTRGDATLKEAEIHGNATMEIGGTLEFETMSAKDADIHAGAVRMGQLTAGTAVVNADRNIEDNGSMVSVDTLTMTAGGDIGSSGSPIETDVKSEIKTISGRNVYLLEHANGHPVKLGVIDASGHLSLSAPWIGGADGAYGFTDGNGDALNIIAGDGFELNLGGKLGSADDPVEAQIHGKTSGSWIIRNGDLTGTDPSYVYIVIGGDGTEYDYTPIYRGTGAIPGLVIVKGRPVLGHPDLLRKIYSALAFSVDTPELKSTQGVFGAPLFLHTDLALFNAGETGVDYWNVINTGLLQPNPLLNAREFRRWGIEGPMWSSLHFARSEAYLKRFEAAPGAEKKPAAPEGRTAGAGKVAPSDGK